MSSRISTNALFKTSQEQVARAREREVKSGEKASTFKEINRPSDDPVGWVTVSNVKDELSAKDTIARNAALANASLTATENALGQIVDCVQRAHELAVTASSNTVTTSETRQALLSEVTTLYDTTLRALNTRYAGRSVLGGFQTRSAAFDANGVYQGDDEKFEIEVGKGLVVPINISARQVVLGEGMAQGVDIPATFQRLMFGLSSGEADAIQTTLPDFFKALDQLSLGRSQIGARMSEIQRAIDNHGNERISTLESISKVEEADVVKAFSDLTRDQNVLKAAMSTAEKILTQNPADIFFR